MLWLHVVFFDRIHARSPSWVVKPSELSHKFSRVTAVILAVLVSLAFAFLLAVAITR